MMVPRAPLPPTSAPPAAVTEILAKRSALMVDANCDTSSHISSQDFDILSNIFALSFIALLSFWMYSRCRFRIECVPNVSRIFSAIHAHGSAIPARSDTVDEFRGVCAVGLDWALDSSQAVLRRRTGKRSRTLAC